MLNVNRLRVIDARRAPWIGHRGGEGAALLAAVGHPPPRPARVRDRRAAAATGRPRDPAHPGRAAAGRPRGRDHRPHRCRRRGALRPRGAERRPRAPGRLRLSDRIARAAALATLAATHPGLQISLTDTHPLDALELLRTGKIEVAIIFRYDETEPEPPGVRLHHLLDDSVYVLSTRRERGLATLRDATWIAGCERCRSHLLSLCADAGFEPRIGYSSDDMVVMQALVAAGLGVATQTGLALRAHHIDGVVATELPGSKRHIYAATYGEPPDPPATAALLAALAEAAASAVTSSGQNLPRSAAAAGGV